MTKDEIEAALDQAPRDHNYTAEYLLEWFYHHQKTVIAALQSALDASQFSGEDIQCIKNALKVGKNYMEHGDGRYLNHHMQDMDKAIDIISATQVKSEAVDLDALKEKMIFDFEEERESELGRGYELGLCHAVDYLAQNYNITRKTK